MNGSGILKVYLIQTKKYAYRLKFVRAITPEWVLEALKNISTDDSIGFEDEENATENQVQEMIAEVESQERKSVMYENDIDTLGDEEEIQIIGGQERETVVMQSIKSIEDAWFEVNVRNRDRTTDDPNP